MLPVNILFYIHVKIAFLTHKVRILLLLDYLIVALPARIAVKTLVAIVLVTFGAKNVLPNWFIGVKRRPSYCDLMLIHHLYLAKFFEQK